MILFRYCSREVIFNFFSVTGILLAIFIMRQFVRYLTDVAEGKIPLHILFQLTGYQIPYLVSSFLPLGLFLAILLTLGRLQADNELIVMQVGGWSETKMTKMLLMVAFPLFILMVCLKLWWLPHINLLQDQLLQKAKHTPVTKLMQPDRFNQSSDASQIYYAKDVTRDRLHANNVFIAEKDKKTAEWSIVVAKFADIIRNDLGEWLVLKEGTHYQGTPGQFNYQEMQFKHYYIRIKPPVWLGTQDKDKLTTGALWQKKAVPQYRAELMWRISSPIVVLVLTLLAVPLSRIKPRQGRYAKLLIGVMCYVVYFNLLILSKQSAAKDHLSVMVMMLIHLIFVLIGLMLLHQQWLKNREFVRKIYRS